MDITARQPVGHFQTWHILYVVLGSVLMAVPFLLSVWQILSVLICISCGVFVGKVVYRPNTLLPNLLLFLARKRKSHEQHDELTLVRNVCPVCGNAKCKRHRELNVVALKPWINLQVPESVDKSMEEFLQLVLKEFVYAWYRDISQDEAFVDEIRINLRFIASVLLRRLQKVDIPTFITDKVLNTAMKHLHMCLMATRNADGATQVGTSRNIEQVVLDYYGTNLHCALHNRRAELDYLRQFADRVFPYVLPPLALDCRSLCTLLREIVAGVILLPAMDVLADPDKVNQLLLLFFEKSQQTDQPASAVKMVPILENFSKPLRTRNTTLKLTLRDVLDSQEILCSFMKFMKAEASINVLQFYLDIDEFNSKILNPDLKENQLVELHKDLCDLYRSYIDPNSVDCMRLESDIIAQVKSICDQPPAEVKKLQTSTPLFRAHQLAYDLLENTFLPLFHQSDYYYMMICGERLPTRLMRSSSRSAAKRAGEMLTLSRIGSKIKTVLKGVPVEGRPLPDDVDYDAIESDMVLEKQEPLLQQSQQHPPATIESPDDLLLDRPGGDDEVLKDLSAWRVTIPRIRSTRDCDNLRKHLFVFCIEVHRVDVVETDGEPSHWTLERRYHEFYVLEQKLDEFHGGFEDAKLPPKKTFMPKNLEFYELQRELFELYLQKLLTKPVLRCSKLLFSFLSREHSNQEFTASFLDVNLGKRVKSGALKLRIERGQHLDPFLKSFLISTEPSKSKPSRVWSDRDSDTISVSSEKMSNSIYSNNANVEFDATPVSGGQNSNDDLPDGSIDNLTSIYDSILYLAWHIYQAPRWLIRSLMVIRGCLRDTVDAYLDRYLAEKLDSVLSEQHIVRIIELLRDTLFFDNDPPRTDDDKHVRCEQALHELKEFIPSAFVHVIGNQQHNERTKLLFDFLQQPRLNKQLSYMLLDQVILELFPELESSSSSNLSGSVLQSPSDSS